MADDEKSPNLVNRSKQIQVVEERKPMAVFSPFFIKMSNSSGAVLVPADKVMTGDNYATWAKAIRRALKAKNKMGFVDGTVVEPVSSSPEYDQWDVCNNMVASWIYNSLDKKLQVSLAYVNKALDMWRELKERYSQRNAREYQLKKEISRMEQGVDSVIEYYIRIKKLWDELD
ncbi:hypothetical protein CRG98_000121 [Punica granatum]|uniref:Retrotransposon Copia-like N-terminal domain-containing protein n=1 Tax=Punica granatum TaxID=22663 RepID=A0A2I0LFQ3_PUNGR|nr:hypothetical protein CRG98_000121 [Punica granatum]